MEEIEIRDALRRHVTTGEPPLGLTAHSLLSQGRHRQRWRIGLGLGSGGTAAAVLVAGTFALTPLGGPGWDRDSCSLPLARGYRPPPSAPVPYPVATDGAGNPLPTVYPLPSGSPLPTDLPLPPDYPSAYPSLDPLFGGPSSGPTGSPGAQPTFTPTALPTDGPGPSFYPTDPPASGPTEGPLPTVHGPATPTPANVVAAQCHLAKKLREILPDAKFAPDAAPQPFEMYGGPEGYAVNGIIVNGGGASQLRILLERRLEDPEGPAQGWEEQVVAGVVVRTLHDRSDMTIMEAYLPHTTVAAFMTGRMISDRDLAALLAAPELDICR